MTQFWKEKCNQYLVLYGSVFVIKRFKSYIDENLSDRQQYEEMLKYVRIKKING